MRFQFNVFFRRSRRCTVAARRLLLPALLALASACGGGGGGGEDDADASGDTDVFYGFFIDDAVQGLVYATGGKTRTTDVNGVFRFRIDEPIEFFIDEISIGSIDSGLERLTPGDLRGPRIGTQVFRFIQSLDTTPGTPGIDLRGLDLPPTQINFSQSDSFFANDPAVQAALQASIGAGATGVLIDSTTARNEFLAGSNRNIVQADFENLVVYPVAAAGPNEPCIVTFNADLSGASICRDDIAADPADAEENFTWRVASSQVVADIDADTRTTITRNGTTGNRIHVRIQTECLTCDPDVGPVFETEMQTFYSAIPIGTVDFSGRSFTLSGPGGSATATFNANMTAEFDDGNGVETANWSVDGAGNVLLLQGTGAPGAAGLPFTRAILIEGSVTDGRFALLNALVDDTSMDGVADQLEFDTNGRYDGIEVLRSRP